MKFRNDFKFRAITELYTKIKDLNPIKRFSTNEFLSSQLI